MSPAARPRDPGLQPERTSLAWQRSGVNAALVCGLTVLVALHRGDPALIVVTSVLTGLGAAIAGVSVWQVSRERRDGAGQREQPWQRLLAVALVVVAAAVAGIVLAVS